jgi:hypothetical protein
MGTRESKSVRELIRISGIRLLAAGPGSQRIACLLAPRQDYLTFKKVDRPGT